MVWFVTINTAKRLSEVRRIPKLLWPMTKYIVVSVADKMDSHLLTPKLCCVLADSNKFQVLKRGFGCQHDKCPVLQTGQSLNILIRLL